MPAEDLDLAEEDGGIEDQEREPSERRRRVVQDIAAQQLRDYAKRAAAQGTKQVARAGTRAAAQGGKAAAQGSRLAAQAGAQAARAITQALIQAGIVIGSYAAPIGGVILLITLFIVVIAAAVFFFVFYIQKHTQEVNYLIQEIQRDPAGITKFYLNAAWKDIKGLFQ